MVEKSPFIELKDKSAWRIVGRSVRGASHKRAGLPNQDSISWWPDSGEGMPVILAVSDGHGSAKYFRSHRGAQLAVETALNVMEKFLSGQPDSFEESSLTLDASTSQSNGKLDLSNPTVISRMAEEQLPKLLTRNWLEAVEKDIEESQLKDEELERLEVSDEEEAAKVRRRGKVTPVAYGATLLTVVVTQSFILYVQIGDGDILIVNEAEDVHRPIKGDEQLIGNETTSLCTKNAWSDFRVRVQPTIDTEPPLLILLSTDGYANSFRDDESFLQVGPDILREIHTYGLEGIERKLEAWLDEASQSGSGDDITLGIIKRLSGIDRDVIARTASAALTVSEEANKHVKENHTRLDTVERDFAASKETLEKRLESLEGSLTSVAALQKSITMLQQNETHYRLVEKRLVRFQRIALLGLLAIVAVEIGIHLFRPFRASVPQFSTSGQAGTPALTPLATDVPIVTQPANVPPSPEVANTPTQIQLTNPTPKPTSTPKPTQRPTPRVESKATPTSPPKVMPSPAPRSSPPPATTPSP